ncbi:DMT family transporter [Burkholderia sp. WSM2232]|uniref:DMT family transporter n=1 Tax=Burkholderia sp. WSM2232 TaxID=944436 RepID=UPI0004871FD9|nr:DMT family transporter [Burkholderia sp. WSM2232]
MNSSIFIALLAGTMLPMQAVINARLARPLGSPLWAAAISGAVTTIALVIIGLAASRGLPRSEGAADVPLWSWTGGLCGAIALTAMTATAPRLGAATMIAMVVTGQVMFSLLVDRYALFGSAPYPLTPRRVLAACLLLVGALLFSKRTNP